MGNFLKKIINYLIIAVLIVFTYYHIQFARYYNPYGLKLLVDEEAIFNSNARRVFDSTLWHLFDDTVDERLLAKEELSKSINYTDYINLKKIISSFEKPLIIFNTLDEIRSMQILFNKGLYINIKKIDSKKIPDEINKYIERSKYFNFSNNKEVCILTNHKLDNFINGIFANVIYQKQDRITLRCK